MDEFRKHAVWSTLLDLAQAAEDGELVIRHSHIDFIRLYVVLSNWLEFGGWRGVKEPAEPQYKSLQRFKCRVAYSVTTGSSNASRAYAMNFLRSVLLIAPIGLISAVCGYEYL